MMNQLCIEDGDIVVVHYVSLPLAVYSKFQPQTVDFLDIHNPKAVYPLNVWLLKQKGTHLNTGCMVFNSH